MQKNHLLRLFIVCYQHFKDHLRIMKLSVLLLFTGIFQLVAANVGAQNAVIRIPDRSLSVEQLIMEIEKQTDFWLYTASAK